MPMDWASAEFASLKLRDKRLNKRLARVSQKLYENPMFSINKACGSWTDTKAAYRLFDNEDVVSAKILDAHRDKTVERAKEYRTVLAIQDTTFIHFKNYENREELGIIRANSNDGRGVLAHSTLLTTTDGVPLGLMEQEIYMRKSGKYTGKWWLAPIEKKEDFRWIKAAQTLKAYLPEVIQSVVVGDREADIYQLLLFITDVGQDYLIRSNHNRIIGERQKRWSGEENDFLEDVLKAEPVRGRVEIEIEDQKTKKRRKARLKIKFCKVTLPAPHHVHNSYKNYPHFDTYVVEVEELNPPRGGTAIYWRLLTSLEVTTLEAAIEKVEWYKIRWCIETFHKVLKSGCRVEETRLQTFDRLERYLTLFSVIAWRIFWMTKISRKYPDIPCTEVFEDHEWKALYLMTEKGKSLPSKPPPTREAIRRMASLGGFLGRKSDGEPGIQTIWIGWQQLNIMSQTFLKLNCG